ncbi:tetratricopeptide repeat protein [Chitinivibrio alkaliphilus]|uniref:Tol-pal system protein YbgF n=1 Tax=Chitinivibrio alkaliphilus ACht1 TaxID=1313304 RepID=U7DBJ4_9BACT|nr:tetratricopeptide repeat protein [Chitinivibrio alkaliphilus]ERP31800.1 tol-pal system protein YbgF [Chitinivibrio alkaliphilus ACht1]
MKYVVLICLFLFACGRHESLHRDKQNHSYSLEEQKKATRALTEKVQLQEDHIRQLETRLHTHEEALDQLRIQQDELSPVQLEELSLRLTLLIQAYRDLYSQVQAIRVLPQVHSKKESPKRPDGFTTSEVLQAILGGDEYPLYSRGLDQYRSGFFEETIKTMNIFMEKYPESSFLADALYWKAESHRQLKRYDTALTLYTQVEKTPQSSKRDAASFRIAQCYLALSETAKAKEQLQYTLSRYPATVYAENIRRLLARIDE